MSSTVDHHPTCQIREQNVDYPNLFLGDTQSSGGDLNILVELIQSLEAMLLSDFFASAETDQPSTSVSDSLLTPLFQDFQGQDSTTPLNQTVSHDATAKQGQTTTGNYFPDGQCTWGAQNLFHEATGTYLDVTGNADQWSAQAANAGWTVDGTPSAQSVVVFQDGVQGASAEYGHVAYVVGVKNGGKQVVIREMNNSVYGGPGIYNDRTVDVGPGMQFIHIPSSMVQHPIAEGPTEPA